MDFERYNPGQLEHFEDGSEGVEISQILEFVAWSCPNITLAWRLFFQSESNLQQIHQMFSDNMISESLKEQLIGQGQVLKQSDIARTFDLEFDVGDETGGGSDAKNTMWVTGFG